MAGGTGVVGRHVVDLVRAAGDEPVVLARSVGVDLASGAGLREALEGVDAVVDVANVTTVNRRRSVAYFEAATTNLLSAGESAGVRHLLVLSIVGCDRVPLGYYAGKRRQEELVRGGAVPFGILRATQFHEFARQLLDRSGPLVVVPRWQAQTVAAREVAAALVEAVRDEPAGMLPELAGPKRRQMADLVRAVARTRGPQRPVISIPLPGKTGRAMAGGALIPSSDGPRGTQTFEQWLASPDG
nr:NAD(P)H-binding protein [Jatrophihabitans endophyticus]